MTRILVPVFLTLGFFCLAAGWLLLGIWLVALVLILLPPVVLFLLNRTFPATLNLVLTLLISLSAVGLWRGLNFSLALAAVMFALAAWDLGSFSGRLAFASVEDQPHVIEREHLLQLGLILSLGLGLCLASFSIRFAPGFEWAAALAVLTFVGIGALVQWLMNKEV